MKINNFELLVGIFDSEIAKYAFFNEFGTKYIPSRSFLRSTFEENKNKYIKYIKKNINNININKLSEMMVNDVKNKIKSNIPPITHSGTMLIQSGKMLDSIEYKIINEDKK